jgi:tetratricopeptide (TPR) repeat protein
MRWNVPPAPPVLYRMPFRRGKKLNQPFRLIACICIAAFGTPLVAGAQTAPAHIAPKLLQRGTNTTAPAGAGDVMVQVFVKKDGTFKVNKVIKSSNDGNNAAALEIAQTSKYRPATSGGKPVAEYYDFKVSFAGETAAIGSGPMATILGEIRTGKYDQAKSDLATYLQTNPNDTQAYTLLGVANAFGGDPAAASAAFAKAGTIPPQYQTLALQSYEKYATAALNDKKYSDAIDAANRAIALNANSLQAYYDRGQANMGAQNYTAAIADLQKAQSIAATAKSDAQTISTLAFTLAVAQLDAGQFGEAAQSAKDIYRNDTARSAQLDKFAYTAAMNAAITLANAGQNPNAIGRLESGAAAFPHDAGALTAEAAYIMAIDKKPDWDKVKAEAQKALDLDPNAGKADFVLGVVASQKSDQKTAVDYFNKAKATPDYGSDPSLAKQINDALAKLNGASKPQQ